MLTNKGKYGLKAMVHLAGMPAGQPALVADIAADERDPEEIPRRDPGRIAHRRLRPFEERPRRRLCARPPGDRNHGRRRSSARSTGRWRRSAARAAPSTAAARIAPEDRPCSVRLVMVQVRDAIAAVLDSRSLAEMRTLAETDADGLMYHI